MAEKTPEQNPGAGRSRIGLFVPCFIDAFYPQVGIATLELLERLGCNVDYPFDQTCCGQPMVNAGAHADAAATEQLFVDNFAEFDTIVAPSGSCVHQVRDNLTAIEQTPAVRHVRDNTLELVEYLHDVLKIEAFPWARFAHRVGYHDSCNTLRNLGHGKPSELRGPDYSKPRALLQNVAGIELVSPSRPDECCGFGGTFSVTEPEVSGRMGRDKVADHGRAGAEYIVSADTSCLMHQQGVAAREGATMRFKHIAEILNGDPS